MAWQFAALPRITKQTNEVRRGGEKLSIGRVCLHDQNQGREPGARKLLRDLPIYRRRGFSGDGVATLPGMGHGKASRLKPLLQVRKNACGAGGYLWGGVYPGRRGWERHSRRSIVTPAGIKPGPHTKCDGAARRLGVFVGPGLSRPTGLGTTLRAGSAPPLAGLKPALPGSERPSRLPGQQKRPPRFPGATLVQPREPFYARLLLTTSYTSGDSSPLARMRSSSPRISAWRAGANLRQRVSGASWRAAICGLKPSSAMT